MLMSRRWASPETVAGPPTASETSIAMWRSRLVPPTWSAGGHMAGRLDTDEFADRYGRCLQAETCAELDELIVDLPTEGDPTFAAERVQARRGTRPDRVWEGGPRRAGGHPWPLPIFALLAVVLALALVSGAHVAWVALPLLFFFVVRPLMLRSMWRGGSRGWGPWACHSRFAGPGTTNP